MATRRKPLELEEPLSEAELEHFQQKLLQLRYEVSERIRNRADTTRVENFSELTEEIDQANHATEEAFNMRLLDKEVKLLREIETALGKFELGTYGICQGTEEQIERKRLEARPWTRYSVAYKEQLERDKKGRVSR